MKDEICRTMTSQRILIILSLFCYNVHNTYNIAIIDNFLSNLFAAIYNESTKSAEPSLACRHMNYFFTLKRISTHTHQTSNMNRCCYTLRTNFSRPRIHQNSFHS